MEKDELSETSNSHNGNTWIKHFGGEPWIKGGRDKKIYFSGNSWKYRIQFSFKLLVNSIYGDRYIEMDSSTLR
jgi:hypothetical protein